MNTLSANMIELACNIATVADSTENTGRAIELYNAAEGLYRASGFTFASADTARRDAQDRLFGRDSATYVFCKEA